MTRKNSIICFLATFLVLQVYGIDKPTKITKTCITADCHTNFKKKPYLHGPLALGDCNACHVVSDARKHTFVPTRTGAALCSFCHLKQTVEKVVHSPLQTGDCLECHDPHSSNHPKMLRTDTIAQLCQTCHKTNWTAQKYMHGPVASGDCTLCHNSHSSKYANLLVEKPPKLCFLCHEATQKELDKLEFIHQPVKEGCLKCHEVHAGNNRMILRQAEPELCFACHENIQNVVKKTKVKHSVVTEKDGCSHCHTPHASSVQFELKGDQLDLCIVCHDKVITKKNGEIIKNFKAEITGQKFMHGPVRQKECSSCHISHGSEYFRLLIKPYPETFYAPFAVKNYALCFTCHQQDLVLIKKTDKLTNFRNGDLNLHYLHVNMPQRGRTCRSCHATHASSLPNHIRQFVPYGKWELPIQYVKNKTGGSCKPGCHKPRKYDRLKPVDYNRQATGGAVETGKRKLE